ncbi:NAD-dependent dehydratase [Achromobacter sp. HZ28]|nr:NAD-dependent dehydratase [Achromobacter sp. HZ34]OWT73113.1 NAD-dependent dehydratase [Achromobacter sp. HZ28]
MNVLVCGARGFIGAALCEALARDGHRVFKGVRHARLRKNRRDESGEGGGVHGASSNQIGADEIGIDYAIDTDSATWVPRLQNIDVVINAIGILVEGQGQTFDLLHRRAPIALFDACQQAGVQHIVQISALGTQNGATRYFQSKRAADDHLRSLPIRHHVLRPALVYGTAGASARFFRALATSPIHPLPAGGHQLLRPIHVDELAEIVVRLLRSGAAQGAAWDAVPDTVDAAVNDAGDQSLRRPVSKQSPGSADEPPLGLSVGQPLDLVGGTQVEYRDMLAAYRKSLGFPAAWRISIPAPLIALGATLLDRVPGSVLTRDTWRMLNEGNTAEAATTAKILGRAPAGVDAFIRPQDAPALRQEGLAAWRPPLLRGALALTWIGTAICSAFIYPQAASLDLLARVHLHGALALAVLYLASALDFILGVATLLRPGRRLWAAQVLLITGYSVLIAFALPEFLWHPFGPILKNLPILALLFVLFSEETQA